MSESFINAVSERVEHRDKINAVIRERDAAEKKANKQKRKELKELIAPRREAADQILDILARVGATESIVRDPQIRGVKHRLLVSEPVPVGELNQPDFEGRTHGFAVLYRKDRLYKTTREGILGVMGVSTREVLEDGVLEAGIDMFVGTAEGESLTLIEGSDAKAEITGECLHLMRSGKRQQIENYIDTNYSSFSTHTGNTQSGRLTEWLGEIEEVIGQQASVPSEVRD